MTPTTPVTSATTAASPTETTKSKEPEQPLSNRLSGDFNTFLKLLTAQMQNQDPLQPTDNTEFVAQLANFSSVEQQVQSNTALRAILDQLTAGPTDGMAQWIDKDVLVTGGKTAYNGTPIDIEVKPYKDADRAELVVKDSSGVPVARIGIEKDAAKLTWDGKTESGQPLPHGLYSFSVESYEKGSVTSSQLGSVFSHVSEVRRTDDGIELIVDGGKSVNIKDINAIR